MQGDSSRTKRLLACCRRQHWAVQVLDYPGRPASVSKRLNGSAVWPDAKDWAAVTGRYTDPSEVSAKTTYRDAGVNIEEADRAVSFIKRRAPGTFTSGVLTSIGSFGAGFALEGWRKPVLISSADGVGTKLKIAFATGRHDTIGEDLVNHCVNDIAVQGAKPLFFLDYFAVGKLDAAVVSSVISGIARGCKKNGCALIGGETAEMPGMYAPGEYDLAGFIVGAVERKQLLTGSTVKPGDVLIGLPSNGLHTNGYSLARKLLFEQAGYKPGSKIPELSGELGGRAIEGPPLLSEAIANSTSGKAAEGSRTYHRRRFNGQCAARSPAGMRCRNPSGLVAETTHF